MDTVQELVVPCSGKALVTGRAYTIETRCKACGSAKGVVTSIVRGTILKLQYKDDRGLEFTFDSSDNCKIEDHTKDVQKIGGWDADSQVARPLAMTNNQVTSFQRGYREVAQIAPITVDGKPATCDIGKKIVYGYSKVSGISGQCYALPDTSQIIVDGRSSAFFACNAAQCQQLYNLPLDYRLNKNFVCEKGVSAVQQCQVATDCKSHFVDTIDSSGKVVTTLREATSCTQNLCAYSDKVVGCNPQQVYSNTLICKKDVFGNYVLEAASTTVTAPGQRLIPPLGVEEGGEPKPLFDTNLILIIVLIAVVVIFVVVIATNKKKR